MIEKRVQEPSDVLRSETVNATSGQPGRGRLNGCGILVAEADAAQRKLVHRLLEKEGARITTVAGSAEAVVALFGHDARDEDTDIVLLNPNLPTVGDVNAVERLRDGGFARTIIAMAWSADSARQSAWLNAGFNDHIAKPIRRDALIDLIEAHIEQRKPVTDVE